MKAGFVAILGRPNVGKSTLINQLVGTKISIVSAKPQTTRDAIQGVVTRPEGQIVFVDSPGVHEPKLELGKRMMREVDRAAAGCHAVVLVVDATRARPDADPLSLALVRRTQAPVLLALNKIDALKDKRHLLPIIEAYRGAYDFAEFVPISALSGYGVELLIELLLKILPDAPPFYPEDALTDQPERFLAAELIREQVLHETRQEVPHSTTVMIDRWEETPRLLKLSATVYVERPGQKAILLGSQGAQMKRIATAAREALVERFDRKIFLEVFVKVKPKWRDRPGFMRELDRYRFAMESMSAGDDLEDDVEDGPALVEQPPEA